MSRGSAFWCKLTRPYRKLLHPKLETQPGVRCNADAVRADIWHLASGALHQAYDSKVPERNKVLLLRRDPASTSGLCVRDLEHHFLGSESPVVGQEPC